MTPRGFLAGLEFHGIKFGLDKIRAILAAAGNPQDRCPAVHIAGTNGKGSAAAMVDAMLRAAGYHTGRFTSPHLLEVNERFLYDARPIADAELDAQLAWFQPVAEGLESPPTYFELVTAVAFRWFAERAVDVGVIEVGMGGRFDSTNVITPVVSAITTIDLEHTQYLGNTLEKIAYEKAGIIKPGVPVVIGEAKPGPRDVLLECAALRRSPVRLVGRDCRYGVEGEPFHLRFTYEGPHMQLGPVRLGLAGRFQGGNAAVATAIAELLSERFPRLDAAAVATGLASARWPCRLERVLDDPPVVIDVAHNASGAARLARELSRAVVVLAISSDKAAAEMVRSLSRIASPLILTQFEGARALPVARLGEAAGPVPHRRCERLGDALELGLSLAGADQPLLVTGSVFTAGQARAWLAAHRGARLPEF